VSFPFFFPSLPYSLPRRWALRVDPRRVTRSDVISIEKSGEHFRLLYDVKGRFAIHRISEEEATYKLLKVKKVQLGAKGVPFIVTHDGRTIRYPDPAIKVNDTVKFDLVENKIVDHIKFEQGNVGRLYLAAGRTRTDFFLAICPLCSHSSSCSLVVVTRAASVPLSTRSVTSVDTTSFTSVTSSTASSPPVFRTSSSSVTVPRLLSLSPREAVSSLAFRKSVIRAERRRRSSARKPPGLLQLGFFPELQRAFLFAVFSPLLDSRVPSQSSTRLQAYAKLRVKSLCKRGRVPPVSSAFDPRFPPNFQFSRRLPFRRRRGLSGVDHYSPLW
jgi:hypothetical protein